MINIEQKAIDYANLSILLEFMDVPAARHQDIHWLSRNLGIRNKDHPNFNKANELIKKLLKEYYADEVYKPKSD